KIQGHPGNLGRISGKPCVIDIEGFPRGETPMENVRLRETPREASGAPGEAEGDPAGHQEAEGGKQPGLRDVQEQKRRTQRTEGGAEVAPGRVARLRTEITTGD